jgi:hypothetical protein
MSELLYFGAGVLSVINAGLGFLAGHKLSGSRTRCVADGLGQLNELTFNQLEQHNQRVDAVNRRIGRDVSVLSPVEQEIRDAIEQLLQANQELQADLQRTRQDLLALRTKGKRDERVASSLRTAMPAFAESKNTKAHGETPGSQPSVLAGSRSEPMPQPLDVNRRIPSRPFRVEQQIASYDSGRLPETNDFFTVQCWEISWEGFSFLADHPPTFKTIVAALGHEAERKYFSARVSRVSEFSERGKDEFQVACQFTGRLHHHLFDDELTLS